METSQIVAIVMAGYIFSGCISVVFSLSTYKKLWKRMDLKVRSGLPIVERAETKNRVYDKTKVLSMMILIGLNILTWPGFTLSIDDEE